MRAQILTAARAGRHAQAVAEREEDRHIPEKKRAVGGGGDAPVEAIESLRDDEPSNSTTTSEPARGRERKGSPVGR